MSDLKAIPRFALLAGALVAATGCVSVTPGRDGLYARPMGSAPVTANPTPYTAALACLEQSARQYGIVAPRIAVGRVSDLTGRLDDNGGRAVTQGAALMAMTALGKAGVPLVERYETDVSKLEYKLADNKLISDAPGPAGAGERRDYRGVFPGDVTGSEFFLTGGITELNSNIRTTKGGLDLSKGGGAVKVVSLTGNAYVLNVAIDLRLVNTRSLDVVDMVSYQKQIVGRDIGGNAFSFFGGNVLNLSADSGGVEPVHLAVRSLIERAVLEMMTKAYRLQQGACLNPAQDPLASAVVTDAPAPSLFATGYGPYTQAPVVYAGRYPQAVVTQGGLPPAPYARGY
jgi:curli biogenesis system outer membrane secretion channel CsgG